MQNWKVERLQAAAEGAELPAFAPPKPKLAQGLQLTLKVCAELFPTDSFKASLHKCFVDCGYGLQSAQRDLSAFVTYTGHRHGKMNKSLFK